MILSVHVDPTTQDTPNLEEPSTIGVAFACFTCVNPMALAAANQIAD